MRLVETTEIEGVYTLLQALSPKPQGTLTKSIRKIPKKVSIVVQVQRRGTAAMLKGKKPQKDPSP